MLGGRSAAVCGLPPCPMMRRATPLAGNIWLHFLPCLVLLLFVIPQVVASQHVHWGAFLSVLVPEALCLLLSSAYHTFLAQVSHYFFWLRVDVRTRSHSLRDRSLL